MFMYTMRQIYFFLKGWYLKIMEVFGSSDSVRKSIITQYTANGKTPHALTLRFLGAKRQMQRSTRSKLGRTIHAALVFGQQQKSRRFPWEWWTFQGRLCILHTVYILYINIYSYIYIYLYVFLIFVDLEWLQDTKMREDVRSSSSPFFRNHWIFNMILAQWDIDHCPLSMGCGGPMGIRDDMLCV